MPLVVRSAIGSRAAQFGPSTALGNHAIVPMIGQSRGSACRRLSAPSRRQNLGCGRHSSLNLGVDCLCRMHRAAPTVIAAAT